MGSDRAKEHQCRGRHSVAVGGEALPAIRLDEKEQAEAAVLLQTEERRWRAAEWSHGRKGNEMLGDPYPADWESKKRKKAEISVVGCLDGGHAPNTRPLLASVQLVLVDSNTCRSLISRENSLQKLSVYHI